MGMLWGRQKTPHLVLCPGHDSICITTGQCSVPFIFLPGLILHLILHSICSRIEGNALLGLREMLSLPPIKWWLLLLPLHAVPLLCLGSRTWQCGTGQVTSLPPSLCRAHTAGWAHRGSIHQKNIPKTALRMVSSQTSAAGPAGAACGAGAVGEPSAQPWLREQLLYNTNGLNIKHGPCCSADKAHQRAV